MAGMAIVGGGLAGLATAHALARFGIQAEVFEAAPALGEIGAAVNVAPNATRALVAIGLGEKIAEAMEKVGKEGVITALTCWTRWRAGWITD